MMVLATSIHNRRDSLLLTHDNGAEGLKVQKMISEQERLGKVRETSEPHEDRADAS